MQEIVVTSMWRDRLRSLAGDPRDVRLIAGVIACVVLVSLVLWARRAPAQIAPPARAVATPVPSATALVLVHVAGHVRRPGLYEFPQGARIADAIETAGGARSGADLDAINLAELLADGVQVVVPKKGVQAAAPAPTAEPSVALVHINSADQAALETIPGVGPVTATAIVQYRDEIGSFTSIDELIDVDGIGPATLEAIRPYVTL